MFYRYDEPIEAIYKDLIQRFKTSIDFIIKDWNDVISIRDYKLKSVAVPDDEVKLLKEKVLYDQFDFIVERLKNLLTTAFVTDNKLVVQFINELRSIFKRQAQDVKSLVVIDPGAFKKYFGRFCDETVIFAFLFFKSWLSQLKDEDAYEILIINCDQFLAYSFEFNEREMDIQMVREIKGRLYNLCKALRDSYQHKLFLNLNRQTVRNYGDIPHRIIENKVQDIRYNNLKSVWDAKRMELYHGLINMLTEEGYIVNQQNFVVSFSKWIPKYTWTQKMGNIKLNALVSVLLKEKLINGNSDTLEYAFRNTFEIHFKDFTFFKNSDKQLASGHKQYDHLSLLVKKLISSGSTKII